MNRRVLHIQNAPVGQIKVLWWWVTVKRFADMSDAVKWLGYDEED